MSPRFFALFALSALLAQPVARAYTPDHQFQLEMRDGYVLTTDLYIPSTPPPWSTVLIRTPYGRDNIANPAQVTNFDLALVVQDQRGGVIASGEYTPFSSEGWGNQQDGYDTLAWIASQEWSNGRVKMEGASAPGIAGLLAAGASPPALAGVEAVTSAGNLYSAIVFPGGMFRRSLVTGYLNRVDNIESLSVIADHPSQDAFWDSVTLSQRYDDIHVPILQVAGWYDPYVADQIDIAQTLEYGGSEGALGNQFLVVGPWTHARVWRQEQGELFFPENVTWPANPELTDLITDFEAIVLRGRDSELFEGPFMHYYVMGDVTSGEHPGNEWRSTDIWPPPHVDVPLYLGEGGALESEPDARSPEARSTYTSDPRRPVPTLGGTNIFWYAGPYDQTELASREDVIRFTTDPLPVSYEIIGDLTARLHVSTTVPDADLIVRVCDLYPDGRSFQITEGNLQLRRRNGFDRNDPMPIGEIVEVEIPLGPTAIALAPGHCLDVYIQSTSYPRFEPNPQHGGPFILDDPGDQVGEITIHHSDRYPSHILIPRGVQNLLDLVERHILGLETSTLGLDLNSDGSIDAGDLVQTVIRNSQNSGSQGETPSPEDSALPSQ